MSKTMLTDYELDELHESYEMPFESGSTIDCLEDEYETVYRCGIDDNSELLRHAYTVESMIAVVESPVRERDPELYESILADERQHRREYVNENYDNPSEEIIEWHVDRVEVHHAIVVHKGVIYDPQTPIYCPSLGSLSGDDKFEHEYEVTSAFLCLNDGYAFDGDQLPRDAAGIENRAELPEYR